eukprot:TRINITY_DN80920_c0_g1_i1.p1 TRINITY_DN80920_c0_g1~~TRINITY_DN80920_c0_g1_i1.p1  ORF type:complete len:322 (-),score=75.33 TRINITY_DN80920_c0_g1_i1:52-1017(-)
MRLFEQCSSWQARPMWHRLAALAASVSVAEALTMRQKSMMRIINGTAVEHASPFRAEFALPTSAGDSDAWLGCGASVISPTFALSSAHCFGGGEDPCSGPGDIALWIGDVEIVDGKVVPAHPDAKAFRVEADLVCNPKFDGKCSHGNDVALLKFRETAPDWVKPVPLNFNGVAVGDVVRPIGYGMTESKSDRKVIGDTSSMLRQASVTVLAQDNVRCGRVYAGGYGCSDEASEGKAENLDMQLCAGSEEEPDEDACAGDSGSPVMDAQGMQVGIVSYGGGPGEKRSGSGRMCGDPEYPGVYAQVSAFKQFISEHVTDLPSA